MNEAFRTERVGMTELWVVDRPAARNAIDEKVVLGLEQALSQAEQDLSLRAVALTGADEQAFIAGADLKFLRDADAERRSEQDRRMLRVLERLEALPIPVIAALNGVVLGGGSEVALACDLRIAEPHASITFKHAAMGVTPGWGGLARLTAIVGRGAASKLLFTALPVTAEEALRIGLVDEVAERGRARERALELADAVAHVSPSAIADMKRLLSLSYRQGPALTLPEERQTFLARAQSDDHREALSAFFAKRSPQFTPRKG